MVNKDYEQTLKLKHNELPAKINAETGELVPLRKKRTQPEGNDTIVFEPKATFHKSFTKSWIYLDKILKPHEYKAAHKLAFKAKAFTNSLEPLNDDTLINILVEELGVGKNQVKQVLQKLFVLGVYGKFEIAEYGKPFTKYWILNPYLSFNGKVINKSVAELFKNTLVAQAFRGEIK